MILIILNKSMLDPIVPFKPQRTNSITIILLKDLAILTNASKYYYDMYHNNLCKIVIIPC